MSFVTKQESGKCPQRKMCKFTAVSPTALSKTLFFNLTVNWNDLRIGDCVVLKFILRWCAEKTVKSRRETLIGAGLACSYLS